MAGDSAANFIARWDGSTWTPLDSGTDDHVVALAVSGSDLYVGGGFTTVGGTTVDRIAKWNGSNWSALGSGMNSWVSTLAVSGNDLYAGGSFTEVGGKFSSFIARAYLLPLPALSVFRSGPNLTISWPSADSNGFVFEQSSTLGPSATWGPGTTSIAVHGTRKSITLPATNSVQFFRLRKP